MEQQVPVVPLDLQVMLVKLDLQETPEPQEEWVHLDLLALEELEDHQEQTIKVVAWKSMNA